MHLIYIIFEQYVKSDVKILNRKVVILLLVFILDLNIIIDYSFNILISHLSQMKLIDIDYSKDRR